MADNISTPATEKDRRQAEITDKIRNSPEIAEVLAKMKALAERLSTEFIPAWLVMQVLEDELRTSEFGEMVHVSIRL